MQPMSSLCFLGVQMLKQCMCLGGVMTQFLANELAGCSWPEVAQSPVTVRHVPPHQGGMAPPGNARIEVVRQQWGLVGL